MKLNRITALTIILLFTISQVYALDPVKRETELLEQLRSGKLTEEQKVTVWYNLASAYVGYKNDEARKYAQKLLQNKSEISITFLLNDQSALSYRPSAPTVPLTMLNLNEYRGLKLYLKKAPMAGFPDF